MQPLISVIVPIYNVEAYLERCVKSIQSQTYSNLEILLVDDGSPDGCGLLCDSLAEKDSRIRVIHKQNGGLSDARNAGLDKALGEYIAFVDSDDYIAPSFVRNLYEQLIATGSDVALCSYVTVTGEALEEVSDDPVVEVYDRNALLRNLYDANHEDATYFIVAWNKLYKSALWREVRFPKGKIHEDEATTYRIFDLCQKGVYVKTPMYGYYDAAGSITREAFSLRRLNWIDALDERIRFFEEKGEPELVACALRARADGAIRYYYPLAAFCREHPSCRGEMKRLKACVKKARVANRRYHNLKLRTWIGYLIFAVSPYIYRRLNPEMKNKG
ncbi:MAG: glycosyltransferase family 2 protein [Lachnospiraceae bacterium]|nr:glycosyltransferase family 2 protein [Lachnospiraceae bacterium]